MLPYLPPGRFPLDGLPWSAGRMADWPQPLGRCRWCGKHGAGLIFPIGGDDGPVGRWCNHLCLSHDSANQPRPPVAAQGELF